TAQDDDLSGNTIAGLTNQQTNPAYAVNAPDDWWGSLSGPTTSANPGGNGTGVSTNVNFSPWIGLYSNTATVGFYPTRVTLYTAPTFSALTGPTIVYGTSTTTLIGHLGSGTAYPTGSSVSITLNSVVRTATVDGSGNFTTTFSTASLNVMGGPYTVTYA